MNTIKVKPWGEGQGDHVVINEEDFNPEFHKKLDDDDSPAAGRGPTVKDITKILEDGGVEIPKTAKKKEDFEKLLADYTADVKKQLTDAEIEFAEDAKIEELQAMLKTHTESQNQQ
ncbi:hypothetical protein [Pseudohongiella sp. O18]|uniref:hypothetical protein n=1 Tax=Pseudohongiella sp. O18 TaxID=2904248 RepID=UPI001F1E13FB|nr:hypothetical protein [Pseudohongiella sp. O18]